MFPMNTRLKIEGLLILLIPINVNFVYSVLSVWHKNLNNAKNNNKKQQQQNKKKKKKKKKTTTTKKQNKKKKNKQKNKLITLAYKIRKGKKIALLGFRCFNYLFYIIFFSSKCA